MGSHGLEKAHNISDSISNISFINKIPKAFFRGSFTGLDNKDHSKRVSTKNWRYTQRGGIILLSERYPNLVDAKTTTKRNIPSKYKNIKWRDDEYQMRYQFNIYLDGYGVADRIYRQLGYKNILLMPEPIGWFEYWWNDTLIPYYNYVPFNNILLDNGTDLVKKLKLYINNSNLDISSNLTMISDNLQKLSRKDDLIGYHRHDCYTINLLNRPSAKVFTILCKIFSKKSAIRLHIKPVTRRSYGS